MADSEIKIFYSWQSDLPGNQTRNLIQESINNAVKVLRDTVEIDADRDTKGEFGSPDIVQTIFSKIDECDLFIADVSVINKYTSIDENGNPIDGVKTTPNPNVLLELGYAAKTLGWDRVICVINTDFGDISDLPFDIAHRRLTPFSLSNKSKADIRKELREIIVATVTDMMENGFSKRMNEQFAYHIVGSYNFCEKKVLGALSPFSVCNLKGYEKLRQKPLQECRNLISKIDMMKLDALIEISKEVSKEKIDQTSVKKSNSLITPKLRPSDKDFIQKMINEPHHVKIKEDDIENITSKAKVLFDIDLQEEFFCMGNLKSTISFTPGQQTKYIGTDEEIKKHDTFGKLDYQLHRLELLKMYIKTFDGMMLIPLAISNISSSMDNDVTVFVKVDEKTAEVILPTAELFSAEIKGLEGIVYEQGILKEMFLMEENSEIQYDKDISYDVLDDMRRMQKQAPFSFGQQYPHFDSEDYEIELRKYIALPREGTSDFEFSISSLRPKENKWLGAAILVRPIQKTIKIDYTIKSHSSNGELCGTLLYDF